MKEAEFVQLMGVMGLVVLKQASDGEFRMVTSSPSWFERFRPQVFPDGPGFRPERLSPVLDDFVMASSPIWEGPAGPPARQDSGWFTQRDRDGEVHYIKATAVRVNATNYMVLEQASQDSELFATLHKYRQGMLEHERLAGKKKAEKDVMEQSVDWSPVDHVTGLRNRDSFLNEAPGFFQNAKINRRPVYVFVIRLQGLKAIREKFGSSEESAALFACSEILRKTFRKMDLRARFPNNAFVVAAMETHFDFRKILEDRLRKNMEKYNASSFKAYAVRLRVGVVRHDYKEEADLKQLIREADLKLSGKRPAVTHSREVTRIPSTSVDAQAIPQVKPSVG